MSLKFYEGKGYHLASNFLTMPSCPLLLEAGDRVTAAFSPSLWTVLCLSVECPRLELEGTLVMMTSALSSFYGWGD